MGKENVISNETLVIEVERKKSSAYDWFVRVSSFCISSVLFLVGFLHCLTIVGILIGFPLMVFSLPFFMVSIGSQKVNCPHCDKKGYVLKKADNLKCKKCENLTIINWK